MNATVSVAALREWLDSEFDKAPCPDAKLLIAGLKMSLADMVLDRLEPPAVDVPSPGVLPLEPTGAMVDAGRLSVVAGMNFARTHEDIARRVWATMASAAP